MTGVASIVRQRLPSPIRHLGAYAMVPFWRAAFRNADRRGALVADSLAVVSGAGLIPNYFGAVQKRSEILRLLKELEKRRPRTVLEIGTANGGTLWLLAHAAATDALLVTVDLPVDGRPGGYSRWREPVYRSFARDQQRVVIVRGDSHRAETRSEISRVLSGRLVDFLLIDGDHSSEGASADWRDYGPFVAPGGLIAFHDIVPGPEDLVGGVPALWQELRPQHASEEFVEDWQQGGFGLGLILK